MLIDIDVRIRSMARVYVGCDVRTHAHTPVGQRLFSLALITANMWHACHLHEAKLSQFYLPIHHRRSLYDP